MFLELSDLVENREKLLHFLQKPGLSFKIRKYFSKQ